jgi:hypothetical protein
VKERPILFSGAMVRAILQGRKTQTRRVVKPQPDCTRTSLASCVGNRSVRVIAMRQGMYSIFCPYGRPGGRLWVKETWKPDPSWGQANEPTMKIQEGSNILYCSTIPDGHAKHEFGKWRPSIFMRRWMSRITLEITAVRVERLQDLTEADAVAEGCSDKVLCEGVEMWTNPREEYMELWDSINGDGSWDANPFVWVLEFRRVQP